MIKIFSSEDRFQVARVKDMLDANHIPCFIKNEFSIGGVGELSPFDAWPEVWLSDEEWQSKALRLIDELQSGSGDGAEWRCPSCGEHNDATFEICWQCQQPRSAT
ncbi:DUF2007 domain-containing protein [Aestuariibacter salexigens]|uniref:putative signal transducing protein n=1 Tax=Aestuariibacter salexigens TaxID=226010 RepID=UPI00040668ED|nr:DUF2007 domain-containing protein [Aestuariibacter salexigens]